MKLLRVAVCVSLAACAAGPAWAQYGLYGAPDVLQLQPTPALAANSVAPSAYQAEQGPMVTSAFAPGPVDPTAPLASNAPVPPIPAAYAPTPSRAPTADPGYSSCCTPSYQPPCAPTCGGGGCGGQNATGVSLAGCGCSDWTAGEWYASVMALALSRDKANKLWTTYQGGNPPNPANQMMNTQQASAGWGYGGEITFGRTFCCGQWSLEATYWSTSDMTGSSCCSIPGGYVSSPLNTGLVYFGGLPAENWFDGALQHTLNRTDEVNDLEINLVRNRLCGDCCSPLSIDLLAGIRFFRFRDNLCFGAQNEGDESWAYFSDSATNNFVGFQLGFNVNYCVCNRVNFFVRPEFGIYDNYMTSNFGADMYGTDGSHCVGTQNTYPGLCYPVQTHCNDFAFLTQVDVGVDWQITPCLSACVGYRVMAATGVALADNQFPSWLNDIPAMQDIEHNGSLILYGAFAGLTYKF